MNEQVELRLAVDELYRVFAPYKLAPHVAGCDHCTSDADHAAIHAAPLRQLTVDHLERYAFKAMTTWGTVDDFRHFLPRIFELLESESLGYVDAEVIFGKLTYGEWRRWPNVEQTAVERYMMARWCHALSMFPGPTRAERVLASIARAVDDLTPYLDAWPIATSLEAACQFADFATWLQPGSQRLAKNPQFLGAYWEDRPRQIAEVINWLIHPARTAELESAFFTFAQDDAELAQLLSDGVEALKVVRIIVPWQDDRPAAR